MLFCILSLLFYPASYYFCYNDQNSLPNSILFYVYCKEYYSTCYVITSCKERFITLASAKLILHDGIVDKALTLKLIRKLIIKELVESFEFILLCKIQWDDSSLARLHSYRLYIALLQYFKYSLVGYRFTPERRRVSTFDVERTYLTSE